MPITAPRAAPDDAPRMSGDTSGLRKRPWNAVPATASAAPTSAAASTRGPRTCRITFRRRPVLGTMTAEFSEQYVGELGQRYRIAADCEGEQQSHDQHSGCDREARQGGAGQLVSPGQHMVDLRVARGDVIEHRVEFAGLRAQYPPEICPGTGSLPATAGRSAGSPRGEIHPAERHFGRQMHAAIADRRDRRPGRIAADVRGEILVDCDDDVRIPEQHLFDRDIGETTARAAGDVARRAFRSSRR